MYRLLLSLSGLAFYICFIFLLVAKSPSEGSSFFSLMAFDVLGWGYSFLGKEWALFFPLAILFCCFSTKEAIADDCRGSFWGGSKWLAPPSEEKPRRGGALILGSVVSVSHSQQPGLKMLTLICCYTLLTAKRKYLVPVAKPGTNTRHKTKTGKAPTNRPRLVSSGSNISQPGGETAEFWVFACWFLKKKDP